MEQVKIDIIVEQARRNFARHFAEIMDINLELATKWTKLDHSPVAVTNGKKIIAVEFYINGAIYTIRNGKIVDVKEVQHA